MSTETVDPSEWDTPGGTWRCTGGGGKTQGVWQLCVAHYLESHIKFIFKFLKGEKSQSTTQAPGVPPRPQIPSLCLLALISTVKVASPGTGSSSGREEAAGWQVPHPPRQMSSPCGQVWGRSGWKPWVVVPPGVFGHLGGVKTWLWVLCGGPHELNYKARPESLLSTVQLLRVGRADPRVSGESGMPDSVLPDNCPVGQLTQLLHAV